MAETESARSVPNARHVHELGGITTADIVDGTIEPADFNTAVYGTTATVIAPDDPQSGGSALTVSRNDHQHAIVTGVPAALTKTATASESSGTGFARDVHVHATSALPWGLIAQQQLTASSSAFSAPGATDMALNNVSVVAGRRYAISLHCLAAINAAVGLWHVNLHVNGTYLDTFHRVINGAAVAQRYSVEGTVYWTAPTTQATDDLTVVLDERTDGSTLTLIGGTTTADPPRTFTMTDVGVAV